MGPLTLERTLWYASLNIIMVAYILLFSPLRYKRSISITYGGVVLLVLAVLDIVRFTPQASSGSWHFIGVTLLEILVVQCFAFVISKYHDGRALFTGLSASNLSLVGYVLGIVSATISGNPWLNLFVSGAVNIGVLLLLVRAVRNQYLNLQKQSKSGWLPLCLIPTFYYLLFYFLTSVPELLTNKPYDIPAALCAVGGMVVSYVVVINYISRHFEEEELYRNKALLEGYMKSLRMESATIEAAQQTLAILRHDMRHYISMISVMLDSDDHDGIKQIVGQLDSVVDKSNVPTYCDNPILDSTLQALALRADQDGITLKSSILLEPKDEIGYVEFSAVIANLVENALIATAAYTGGEKSVGVLIQSVKNQLVAEVSNPTESQVDVDSKTGLPIIESNDLHGIGLKSVRDFVERSQGIFHCSCDKYVFVARLSIPLQPVDPAVDPSRL